MGGRFLKRHEDGIGWTEVSYRAARDKVSHSFRTKTKRHDTPRSVDLVGVPSTETQAPAHRNETMRHASFLRQAGEARMFEEIGDMKRKLSLSFESLKTEEPQEYPTTSKRRREQQLIA